MFVECARNMAIIFFLSHKIRVKVCLAIPSIMIKFNQIDKTQLVIPSNRLIIPHASAMRITKKRT